MPRAGKQPPPARGAGDRKQESLHPRSRHRGGLDFARLTATSPELAQFVAVNQWGNESVDFADPAAVKALNKALLKQYYQVAAWDIPPGYLCPSIPGRADYVHCVADLLASSNGGVIPRGAAVRALDLGVGASLVYPLIGNSEYGWRFLGSDIDPLALAAAKLIVDSNPALKGKVELRLQADSRQVLAGLLKPGESVEVTMCNPPFHSSPEEAEAGARRKWKNLGRGGSPGEQPRLNFGGRAKELWCPGGESAFVTTLIEESAALPARSFWFTSLVSKQSSLQALQRALRRASARETRIVEMKQGQKTSRMLAWTFLDEASQEAWRARRWRPG